jgi:hypothetical protein
MPFPVSLVLLVAALIVAVLAAFWTPPSPPPARPYGLPHLGWLALALYLASLVFAKF